MHGKSVPLGEVCFLLERVCWGVYSEGEIGGCVFVTRALSLVSGETVFKQCDAALKFFVLRLWIRDR